MALRDTCRNADNASTVGGPVQIAKVHQHMNATYVPVYWPSKASGVVALRGRILMQGERIDSEVLDLDTFRMHAIVHPPIA